MKRLNPETGKPFKYGDIRLVDPKNKGRTMFWGYGNLKKDGMYAEMWYTPMRFFKLESINKKRSNEANLMPTGRVRRMITNAKNGAKNRNKVFTITEKDVMPSLERGTCSVTGIPFDFSPHPTMNHNPLGPSIDRIDSDKGYSPDNIRVVIWFVNCALGECSDEQALPLLKILVRALEDNAKQKSASPISAGINQQSEEHTKHGIIPAPGTWKDNYDANHHRGAVYGEDPDHSAQAGSGNSVAHRNRKVEPSRAFESREDDGDSVPAVGGTQFTGRRVFD